MRSPLKALDAHEVDIVADMAGGVRALVICKMADELVRQQEESLLRTHTTLENEREVLHKKLKAEGAKALATLLRLYLTTDPKKAQE